MPRSSPTFPPARLSLLFALVAVLVAGAAQAAPWPRRASQSLLLASQPRGICVLGAVSDSVGGARFLAADPCSLYTTIPAGSFPYVTLHAGHVGANGDLVAPGVVTLPLDMHTQFSPSVFADSATGMYVVWADERSFAVSGRDLYAHHLLGNGQLDPAWPVQGRAISTAPGWQQPPVGCSDGRRGLILAWTDRRDSATTSFDVYAAHLRADGTVDPAWPANGRAISNLAGSQFISGLIEDGAGGAIVFYGDSHVPGNRTDVYAKHLLANGTLDPAWPAGGLVVAGTTANETRPIAVRDGAGGAFVDWTANSTGVPDRVTHVLANGTLDPAWPAGGRALDIPGGSPAIADAGLLADGSGGLFVVYDAFDGTTLSLVVLARHLLANGTSDPVWPANPLVINPDAADRFLLGLAPEQRVASDGAGGFRVMFEEQEPTNAYHAVLFEQHVRGNGTLDPLWPARGCIVAAPPSTYVSQIRVPDGAGGEIVFLSDGRDTAAVVAQSYAQHVSRSGLLGTEVPYFNAVRDVPNDQGGHATLFWYAPSRDTMPNDPVDGYAVWRLLDQVTAAGRAIVPPAAAPHAWHAGEVRASPTGTTTTFWEFLASVPARGSDSYAFTVTTRGDSTAAGAARETYEVEAHLSSGSLLTSPPDSGSSVDNLAPAPPTPFTGTYAGGTSTLHWQRNVEPDLAGYRLYRGPLGFTPGPGNQIASPTTPDLADAAGRPYEYALTAVDLHGNESAASRLVPTGALGVDDVPRALAFALASASPASTSARFAIALPAAGHVRVRVYDTAGRLVRTVLDGARPAGTTSAAWDLRDERGGRVAAGLFVAVLDAAGGRREQRIVVIH